MQAYLVIGSSSEKRQEALGRILATYKVTPLNKLIFSPKPSYGIDIIREITRALSIKTPKVGETRAVIIEEAQLMTPEAQNAFLKTLEEPPQDTMIILTVPREEMLLETVVSRCILIQVKGAREVDYDREEQETLFKKLKGSGMGEKVQFAEDLGKSREEALRFVESQLAFLHQKLQNESKPTSNFDLLQALLSTHKDLSSNVNPKMVLFELLRYY